MLRICDSWLSSASAASWMAARASGAGISASTCHTLSSSMLTCGAAQKWVGWQWGQVSRESGQVSRLR